MVRKVIAGKDLLRAAGTVTKKLATWLVEKGYARVEEASDAAERGAAAVRDLPKAKELASRLRRFAEDQERCDKDDEVEDHFTITRVGRDKVWLAGMLDGRELGPIDVPEDISRRCKVGWTISGVVGRVVRRWRIATLSLTAPATVAAFSNAGGLGTLIFAGIHQDDPGRPIAGSL